MPYGYTAQAPNLRDRYSSLDKAFSGASKVVGGIETMAADSKAKKQEEMDNVQAQGKYDATLSELSEYEQALVSEASPEAGASLSEQFKAMKAAVPIKEPGESTASYLNKLNQYKATVIKTTAEIAGQDTMSRAATKLLTAQMTADQLSAEIPKYAGTRSEKMLQDALSRKREQESAGTTSTILGAVSGPEMKPASSQQLESFANRSRADGAQFAPTDQERINKEIETRRGNETNLTQLATLQGSQTPQESIIGASTATGGAPLTSTANQAISAQAKAAADEAERKAKEEKELQDAQQKSISTIRGTMEKTDKSITASESAQTAAEKEVRDLREARAKMTMASPEELKIADARIADAENKVKSLTGRTVDIVDNTEFPTEYSEATKKMLMERYVSPLVKSIMDDGGIGVLSPKGFDQRVDEYASGSRVSSDLKAAIENDKVEQGKFFKPKSQVTEGMRTFAEPRTSDQPIPDNLKAWAKAEVRRQLGAGGAGGPTNPTNGTNQTSAPTSDEEKYIVSAKYYLKRKGVENPSEEEIAAAIAELKARRATLPAQRAALSVASN